MTEEQKMRRWAKLRKLGKFWFPIVLALGTLALTGVVLGLVNYSEDKFYNGIEKPALKMFSSWLPAAVQFIVQFFALKYIWNRMEAEYLKFLNNEQKGSAAKL